VRLLSVATFAAVLFTTGVSAQQQGGAERAAVARVGARTIPAEAFQEVLVAERKAGDQNRMLETLTTGGKARILDREVDRLLFASAAREDRLDEDAAVKREMERAAEAVLVRRYMERLVAGLDLSEPALRSFYDSHREEFVKGGRVRARHIVVATEAEARAVVAELSAGADFAAIASRRNIDASRTKSGDLGWVSRGVMVKPFEDALFSLAEDKTSAVVKTSFGFHVIRAEDVEPPAVQPLGEVVDAVRQKLIEKRVANLKQELQRKYPVTIDREKLATLTR
jgi:peptidyl-prolyl cis-trans isomerase C